MRLCDLNVGNTGILEKIVLPDPVRKRLNELGLTEKSTITLMQKRRGGNVLFRARGVRYAAGKRIAEGIFVKENTVD